MKRQRELKELDKEDVSVIPQPIRKQYDRKHETKFFKYL